MSPSNFDAAGGGSSATINLDAAGEGSTVTGHLGVTLMGAGGMQ